jgi:hypothetical protein
MLTGCQPRSSKGKMGIIRPGSYRDGAGFVRVPNGGYIPFEHGN